MQSKQIRFNSRTHEQTTILKYKKLLLTPKPFIQHHCYFVMLRRIKRIGGLGEGKRLRKAVDLSLRHKSVEVVAVEKADLNQLAHFDYLREKGQRTKPANLTVKAGIAAEKYLAGEKPNSFDHLYAHFLTQHLAFAKRRELFAQVWRTLKPGTRFVVMDAWAYEKPLAMELRNAGFRVSTKRLTPEEVMRLGADNVDINASRSIETREIMELLQRMPAQQAMNIISHATKGKGVTVSDMKRINQQEVREQHDAQFRKYNGPNPPQEALDANKMVMRAIRGEEHYKTPFVIITATKPRVRYV
jgi:SAM-dependent methyltransferase